MFRTIALAAAAAGLMTAAQAAEFEVKALNFDKGKMMVMEPSLLRIAPGDTVHFIVKDKGHNFESVPGMLPDGATPLQGKLNEDLTVTFDKPGVYGVRCRPHYPMGMVGLVVVGDPVNEAAAKEAPQAGKAKTVFADLFGKLDAQKTAAK
jgi:pseudoazurin